MVTCFPAPGRAETMSAGCRPGSGRAMGAVWMRLRSDLRARWRAWLGLALLIGLGGGAAVAAAAGARRTETAYPRFVQTQQGYDLVTGGFPKKLDPERTLTQMAAMPEVLESARLYVAAYAAILPSGRRVSIPELGAFTDPSGRVGYRLNRFKVLSGRLADLGWEVRSGSSLATRTPSPRGWPLCASLGSWPHRASSRPLAPRRTLGVCT